MMSTALRLIKYRCMRAAHQRAPEGRISDSLTVHQGEWAYCPFDTRAKDHDWRATTGIPIEELRRLNAPLDAFAEAEPRPARPLAGRSAPVAPAAARSAPPPSRARRKS